MPLSYYLQIFSVILVLSILFGLLYWINSDTFQSKFKKYILITLWGFIAVFSYKTIDSVYEVIQFDDLNTEIEHLINTELTSLEKIDNYLD